MPELELNSLGGHVEVDPAANRVEVAATTVGEYRVDHALGEEADVAGRETHLGTDASTDTHVGDALGDA